MGEIIKNLCELPGGLVVELNAPQSDGNDFVIHIQNPRGRLSLSKSEFIELAMLFHCAEYNLKSYKRIDNLDNETRK